jgi:hypothetical protein
VSGFLRRTVAVPCTIDIAHTAEGLHAHVELAGLDVEPGDRVLIHDAPAGFAFGARTVSTRIATVRRAGLFARWWTRTRSLFALTELYEVSFSPAPLDARASGRKP